MRPQPPKRISLGLMVGIAILVATPLYACSVPVFRYALERWRSDNYQVTVFYRGSLTDEQHALIDNLGPDGRAGKVFANLNLEAIDLDGNPDDKLLKLWEQQQTDTLPWMIVDYPIPMAAAWSGSLTSENVDQLLDSPVRREIARRILKGESAVWVFLESGNKETDDKTYNMLATEIALAGLNLKLPEIDEQDITDGLVTIEPDELKISFSAIRISRNDPKEKMLVEMLLGSEGAGKDSLRDPEFAGKAMAFPVFGRGRVLYALVGSGINAEMIESTCKELVGPCTCEVKGDNPGVDLVMSINWDNLVESQIDIDTELPPLAGLGSFAENTEAKIIDASATSSTENGGDLIAVANIENSLNASAETPVVADNAGATETTAVVPTKSSVDEESGASLLQNTLIILGMAAAAVIAVSLLLVARKG